MRENLSAPGNVSEWLQISKQALAKLNYHNIAQDPKYARVSAKYGYDDYILVNFRSKDEKHVLIEFDVSSPKMINQFKTASSQIIRQMQQEYERKLEEQRYGKVPVQNVNLSQTEEIEETDSGEPVYIAEEGDYIEKTRYLPDQTLTLKEYHRNKDKLEMDNFKYKFESIFNRLWVIWLMLFLVPPFGIFLIWYFHRMKLFTRILVSVLFFLYFALVWIGFFGVDTGFNRETIQKYYQTQQYKLTHYFNKQDNDAGVYNQYDNTTIENDFYNDNPEAVEDYNAVTPETPQPEQPVQDENYNFFDRALEGFFNILVPSGS